MSIIILSLRDVKPNKYKFRMRIQKPSPYFEESSYIIIYKVWINNLNDILYGLNHHFEILLRDLNLHISGLNFEQSYLCIYSYMNEKLIQEMAYEREKAILKKTICEWELEKPKGPHVT